jgi:hypothetical protein
MLDRFAGDGTGPLVGCPYQSDSWGHALGSIPQHEARLLGKGIPERGRGGAIGVARAAEQRAGQNEGEG